MAEFALGLTKTAVEGTLSRVKSAVEEGVKQRERVQEDLMFITGEFQMMQAFLNASSAGERASKNLVARAWVRQLRNLAFDVEDCVEFVVSLDKPSPWDWVQRLASSLPCLARPPLPLDEAVAEIKRLKARVEDVSQRNTRYNLMAGGGDNGDENKQMIKRPAAGGHTHTSAPGAEAYHVLRDVWKAMGKLHEATGDLKRLIDSEGSELKVISLWGSPEADVVGELGWASIVKTAYYDPEISEEFKNRAWIKLTNPFNPAEFLNNLLTHFTSHRHDRHDDMSKLKIQVSQHKYLIILEQELSSVADWEAIKMCLPDCNNGSRIIVSTKHLGISRVCTGEPFQVWELHRFSHDRYLSAIFPKGCGHRIDMGEFVWQLRRHPAVISLYVRNYEEQNQFLSEWEEAPHEVKFEHEYQHNERNRTGDEDGKFDLDCLADSILAESYPEDTPDSVWEELDGMSTQGITERCREFLTEHEWLVFIVRCLKSPAEWDLIRQHLLCESTRACIVVITGNQSVAKHCVGHQQHLALDVEDLLNKGSSDQQHQSGHADGGQSITINEEGESELVGREDDRCFLFNGFCRLAAVSSVWGIAGVGKSAIVREKYCYYKTYVDEDYKMHGWVDVTHPFSLTDMCRTLLLEFYSGDPDKQETAAIGMVEGQDPIHICCKILREKKCFLVIDDLRSTHEWDLIKATLLSQANIGGRTIVITREESIARHCTDTEEHILNVKGLEASLALDLFKKIALDDKQLSSPEQDILKLIISKCGGLPEIINAIGGKRALGGSLEKGLLESINGDFIGFLGRIPNLRGLFHWMQSYFHACSDELKPCIFYMSIFPAEQSIRQRRLLRRWIAEGYSSGGGGGAAAEGKAEKLLSDFMKLGIFYQGHISSTRRSCKLNGFFREYIKSRPMEDNLVFELEGSCDPSSRLTGQHLTISSSWDRDEIVFNSMDLSRLRSLTVFGKWVPFLISSDKMKMLRVLDLEDTSSTLESDGPGAVTDDDLEMIGKLLTRLKFLSLRGCMEVTHLPDSMAAMRQLETLDVRHTRIVELPPAIITKLHKLQYIRAGNNATTSLTPPPPPSPPPPTQPQPLEEVHSGTSPFLGAKVAAVCVAKQASTRISGAWKRRAHDLVESSSSSSWWESKKQRRRRVRVAENGGGVEVVCAAAEGIGKLTEVHTLGVVNIAGGKGGLALLKELKKLTHLRKLGLSGVNRKNWKDLCLGISGHLPRLESLSLQLLLLEEDDNYEFACFDDISELPKTLKIFKVLYTSTCNSIACIRQTWSSKYREHEWRVSSGDEIGMVFGQYLYGSSPRPHMKPVKELLSLGHLPVPDRSEWRPLDHLRVGCNMMRSLTFGGATFFSVETLNIQCCGYCDGSTCLRIDGLRYLHGLKQVCVMGKYGDGFEQNLRKQLDMHVNKPELKLLSPRTDSDH